MELLHPFEITTGQLHVEQLRAELEPDGIVDLAQRRLWQGRSDLRAEVWALNRLIHDGIFLRPRRSSRVT